MTELNFNYLNLLDPSTRNIDLYIEEISKKKKVVLYFHGGLSSEKYVEGKLGPYLLETMFQESNFSREEVLPIFMIYEAGFFDLEKLLKPFMKKRFIKYLISFLSTKVIGIESNTKEKTKLRNWGSKKYKKEFFKNCVSYAKTDIIDDFNKFTLEQDEKNKIKFTPGGLIRRIYLSSKNKLMVIDAFLGIAMRYANNTDHEPITTIIEEVLKTKYISIIQTLAQNHWKGVENNSKEIWKTQNSLFLKKLLELKIRRENTGNPLDIELVSHSAGSIPVTYLIKKINTLVGLNHTDITFPIINNMLIIAPAVRICLFQKHVLTSKSFNNLRVYNLSEECEEADSIAGFPSSLLYFVSSVAEKELAVGEMTILGMHRFFKRKKPYTKKRYNRENIHGNLDDCVDSFLNDNDKKMILISNNDKFRDLIFSDVIITQGATHKSTKLPHLSKELAKDVICHLSNTAINIDDIDTSNWEAEYNTWFKKD